MFAENYTREREKLPLLPVRAVAEPDWIADSLMQRLEEPGVAVLGEGRLLGYMITGLRFSFKGQQAAACPEFAHAAVEEDKAVLYQLMYMALAGKRGFICTSSFTWPGMRCSRRLSSNSGSGRYWRSD